MNKEEGKREFALKLEQTAQDLTSVVNGQKGKGFILIGADTAADGEDKSTQAIIAVGGSGRQIVESLAQFIGNPQTKPLLDEAMKIATLHRLPKY